MEPAVQELIAKQSISEVLMRFMRACDRGDPAALRECFHPDAVEDHGGTYLGPAGEWADGIEAALSHPKTRMTHCLTNLLIEVEGDVAVAECYVTTTSLVRVDGVVSDSVTCSRLIDRFERRRGEWRVAHRRLRFEWMSVRPHDERWPAVGVDPAAMRRSGKFPDDELYAALAEMRSGSQAGPPRQ